MVSDKVTIMPMVTIIKISYISNSQAAEIGTTDSPRNITGQFNLLMKFLH